MTLKWKWVLCVIRPVLFASQRIGLGIIVLWQLCDPIQWMLKIFHFYVKTNAMYATKALLKIIHIFHEITWWKASLNLPTQFSWLRPNYSVPILSYRKNGRSFFSTVCNIFFIKLSNVNGKRKKREKIYIVFLAFAHTQFHHTSRSKRAAYINTFAHTFYFNMRNNWNFVTAFYRTIFGADTSYARLFNLYYLSWCIFYRSGF